MVRQAPCSLAKIGHRPSKMNSTKAVPVRWLRPSEVGRRKSAIVVEGMECVVLGRAPRELASGEPFRTGSRNPCAASRARAVAAGVQAHLSRRADRVRLFPGFRPGLGHCPLRRGRQTRRMRNGRSGGPDRHARHPPVRPWSSRRRDADRGAWLPHPFAGTLGAPWIRAPSLRTRPVALRQLLHEPYRSDCRLQRPA